MTGSNLVAAFLGVAAAAVFTTSFALQQRANLVVMAAGRTGAVAVMGRREWIGGIALQPVAFALQAVALGIGAFAVVQPALVAQLVFMVPAGAWVLGRRSAARDLSAPLVVLVGLVVFELAARPSGGRDVAPFGDWLVPLVVMLGLFAALLGAAQVLPEYRAALRGAAAGTWGGTIGAFANQVIAVGGDGIAAVLSHWATWALMAAGLTNFVWVNLALRAGRLASALATMSAAPAALSVLLAVTVFDEQLAGGAPAAALAAVGAVLCGVGIALVARSPSLVALGSPPGGAPGGAPGGTPDTQRGTPAPPEGAAGP